MCPFSSPEEYRTRWGLPPDYPVVLRGKQDEKRASIWMRMSPDA
jgi:predicted transcriptional regulator